jgi:hypothetical protein
LAAAQALRRSGYTHDIVALAMVDASLADPGGAAPSAAGDERIEIHVLGVAP